MGPKAGYTENTSFRYSAFPDCVLKGLVARAIRLYEQEPGEPTDSQSFPYTWIWEQDHETGETLFRKNMRRGIDRSGGVAGDHRPGSGRPELDRVTGRKFSRSRKGYSVS